MIELIIENGIKIRGLENRQIRAHIKKTLTLDNPMYYKLKSMGVHVWPGMETYKYYKEDKVTGDLIVPRGFKLRLIEFFVSKLGMEIKIEDKTLSQKMEKPLVSKVILRDYQEEILLTIVINSEGIVCASTGSGKTVMACEAIARMNLKATVIVPNTVLMSQFVEEFKKNFDYTPGIVGDGKKQFDYDVVITTIQSLQADKEVLQKLVERTSVLFVDECQQFITEKREKIIGSFKPSSIFGLSATPIRSKEDGRTEAINFLFGQNIVNYQTTQMTPTVQVILTDVQIPIDDYNEMIINMISNEQRNTIIQGTVLGEVMSGRKVLVLTKRIDHYRNLEKGLPDHFKNNTFFFIDSDDKNRNQLLTELKFGKRDFQAVFGTTSLLSVGLDIPAFDTLILACDMKSEALTIQSAGRILRLFEGKPQPKIYDLFDNRNAIFTRQFKEREKIYKDKGWKMLGKYWD